MVSLSLRSGVITGAVAAILTGVANYLSSNLETATVVGLLTAAFFAFVDFEAKSSPAPAPASA